MSEVTLILTTLRTPFLAGCWDAVLRIWHKDTQIKNTETHCVNEGDPAEFELNTFYSPAQMSDLIMALLGFVICGT